MSRNGTSNGLPVAYVVVNMEPASSWQAQTDSYLGSLNVRICGNDYTPSNHQVVRNIFVPPNSTPGGDPRPVFLAINCISNSPSHAYRQLLVKDFYDGGGAIDFSSQIAGWRNVLDSVQAPPPRITGARFAGGAFEFTIPGQRGRTNRVECATNFVTWTTITNVFGTNAPVLVRDTNASARGHCFYRVVRQ